MIHVLIRHRVRDYDVWKAGFDGFIDHRKAGGENAYHIFRPDDDPNNLILLFEWDSIENAKTFMTSAALKQAMEKAGVVEAPEIHYLNLVDHGALEAQLK
jgi:quinol monooxygenase YgiN